MNTTISNSYFAFEADFVEKNVRCIPMAVRFKLDACGIKLKLQEWSRMTLSERDALASLPCATPSEIHAYRVYLTEAIARRTGNTATEIPVFENPAWSMTDELPYPIQEKLREFNWKISIAQWIRLSDLQRFALLKLSYPGHENRNFPVAMREFQLV